jgi:hypothetical protein
MVVDGLIEPLLSRLNCQRYLLFAFLSKTNSDVDGEIIPPQAVPIAPVVATGNDAEACSRQKRHAAASLGKRCRRQSLQLQALLGPLLLLPVRISVRNVDFMSLFSSLKSSCLTLHDTSVLWSTEPRRHLGASSEINSSDSGRIACPSDATDVQAITTRILGSGSR